LTAQLFIVLFAGLGIGVLLGWLLRLALHRGVPTSRLDEVQGELQAARQNIARLDEQSKSLAQQLDEERKLLAAERDSVRSLGEERGRLDEQNKQLTQRLNEERKALAERIEQQRAELEQMQKALREQFENLANRIFEEKSEKFSALNLERLKPLLEPLRENIEGFRQKVESVHLESTKQNAGLIEQIRHLQELNRQISTDAENLTKALKGDVKVMGNWGEVILERILESSGLRRDVEYHHQAEGLDLEAEPGKGKPRPDVVVHLPENRHLVIDSKVSLVAYERLAAAETEEARESARRELTASIRAHIDGLHAKHYPAVGGLNAPDFVFLFMPIEASFTLAVHPGSDLYEYGIAKNVLVVGPSALLATLRTIAYIWRQENQTRNVLEIAERGSELHSRFVLLIEAMRKVENYLRLTQAEFTRAMGRLCEGPGNLVRQVEMLTDLGVKAKKQIPPDILQRAADDTAPADDDEPTDVNHITFEE